MRTKRGMREADRIRGQVDLAALIGELVPIVRCGNRLVGPCPFCQNDDDRESLEVHVAENIFYCSECGQQGDCFEWLMVTSRLSFDEALRLSAGRLEQFRRVA